MPDTVIAAIIGGVFGALGTAATLWANKGLRKAEEQESEADAAVRIGEAWAALIAPLEKRVKALEDENSHLKARVYELEAENLRKDALIVELEKELDDLRKKVGRNRKSETQTN
jgi:predicted RNase H-like nuclease (RuvC/YqgF family)